MEGCLLSWEDRACSSSCPPHSESHPINAGCRESAVQKFPCVLGRLRSRIRGGGGRVDRAGRRANASAAQFDHDVGSLFRGHRATLTRSVAEVRSRAGRAGLPSAWHSPATRPRRRGRACGSAPASVDRHHRGAHLSPGRGRASRDRFVSGKSLQPPLTRRRRTDGGGCLNLRATSAWTTWAAESGITMGPIDESGVPGSAFCAGSLQSAIRRQEGRTGLVV